MKSPSLSAPFPRLLVATEFAPNMPGGGGAVMRQMLKDWPAGNLFWWSCLPDRDELFGRQVAGRRVAHIPPKLYPNRRWRAQKSWLLDKFWVPWAAGHFRRTLKLFRPDAVWVLPHGWSIQTLARVMPRAGVGFHVSIHDFADRRQSGATEWDVVRGRKLAALADQLYSSATTRDGICQPMVDDLRARTGCDGNVTRAGLEREDFDFLTASKEAPSGGIRIGYAGTIHVDKTFDVFVSALKRIRHQLPLPVTIEFFSDHPYRGRAWFDPSWMNEHGSLPARELAAELEKCAWGFSPMGLTDDDPRYNRFSLPTKFVSYLAAGLPIITLGHPESSVIKIAAAHDVGLCATTADPENLSGQLLAALSQPNPWLKYRDGIQRCAAAEFDAQKMRAALFNCFDQCAALSRKNRLVPDARSS